MKRNILLLVTGCMTLLTGCLKYKEGPIVSLRSKTDRLSNLWMIDKYYVDGIDSTYGYDSLYWRFSKDHSFDRFGFVNGMDWARSGDWEYVDSKKSIRLQNLASDSTYEFRITKLLENHLWFEQMDAQTQITKEWKLKRKKD